MNILDFIFGKSIYENHEHKYTIPHNTHGLKFMKCEICGLMDDVTDHTNHRYEKAKSHHEKVHAIYLHNKPIWDLSSDLYRRMSIVLTTEVGYQNLKDSL